MSLGVWEGGCLTVQGLISPVLHVVSASSRQSYAGDFGDSWLYTCGSH